MPADGVAARPVAARFRTAFGVLLCAAIALWTFPAGPVTTCTGLDCSWSAGLNLAARTGLVFGRDLTFTYGPLGYLLSPGPQNLGRSLLFMGAFQLLLATALATQFLRTRGIASLAVFGICFAIVDGMALDPEYHLLAIVGLASLTALECERPWLLMIASAMSGVLGLAKIALGISAACLLVTSIMLYLWRHRSRGATRIAVSSGALFAAGFLAGAAALFPHVGDFLLWMRGSREILGGYDLAMSIPPPHEQLAFAAVPLALLGAAAVALLWLRSDLLAAVLPFAAVAPIAFKHSFVRHDSGHLRHVHGIALIAFCAMLLFANGWKRAAAAGALVAGLIVLAQALGPDASVREGLTVSWLRGQRADFLAKYISAPGEINAWLERASEENLRRDRLPAKMLGLLTPDTPLAVLPSEIAYCIANGVRWRPLPALQMYSAYTPWLDHRTADFFSADEMAPPFALVDWDAIDGRNPLQEAPAGWLAILAHYDVALREEGHLLLKRKAAPRSVESRRLAQGTIPLNQWLEVPRSTSLVVADLSLRLSLKGRLRRTLFQIPPVFLELTYSNGFTDTVRLVTANATDGIILNALPRSLPDLENLLTGRSVPHVLRFRIVGAGTRWFQDPVPLVWREFPGIPVSD